MRHAARLFARFADADRSRARKALATMLAAAASESVGLALLAPLLSLLTSRGHGGIERIAGMVFAAFGATTERDQLLLIVAALVVTIAIRAVATEARDKALFALQQDFVEERRLTLLRAVSHAQWRDVVTLRHARVTVALNGDIPRLATATHALLRLTVAIAMVAAQLVIVTLIAPMLALLAMVAAASAIAAWTPLMRRAYALGRRTGTRNLRLSDLAGQLLGGLKLALAQNLAAAFFAEFAATARQISDEQRAFELRRLRAPTGVTVAAALTMAVLLVAGWSWHVAPATLLAAVAILSRTVNPLSAALGHLRVLLQALPAWQALEELEAELTVGGGMASAAAASRIDLGDGAVCFEAVVFQHPGTSIGPIDLSLGSGDVLGIVGPSGAGKTTIADLLTGLLTPDAGRITVGGRVLEGAVLAAWRERIAYVAQDGFLFHDTIRRNLCWGLVSVPNDAALWQALATARAESVVRAAPEGLGTIVGERGGRLSGGERQRLALARALLRHPELLILDEALNVIEPALEDAILAELTANVERPIIAIIAHRAATLSHCTHLLTLPSGDTIKTNL